MPPHILRTKSKKADSQKQSKSGVGMWGKWGDVDQSTNYQLEDE